MPEFFSPVSIEDSEDWLVYDLREGSLVPDLPSLAFEGVYQYKPGFSITRIDVAERVSPADVVLDESAVDAYLKKTDTYKAAKVFGDLDQKVILRIRRDAILSAIKTEDAVARLNALCIPVIARTWEKMISRDRKSIFAAENTQPLSFLTKAGLLKLAAGFEASTREFLQAIADGRLPREGRTETIEDFRHRYQHIFDAEGHFQGFQRHQFAKGWLARKVTGDPEKEEWKLESSASVVMPNGYRAPRSSDEYGVWYATLAPWLRQLVAAPEPPRWQFQVPEKNLLPPDLLRELNLQPLMSVYPQVVERTSRSLG
jgi:hypothetical protein